MTHLKAIISPQVDEEIDELNAGQDAPKEHGRGGYVAHVENEWGRIEERRVCLRLATGDSDGENACAENAAGQWRARPEGKEGTTRL